MLCARLLRPAIDFRRRSELRWRRARKGASSPRKGPCPPYVKIQGELSFSLIHADPAGVTTKGRSLMDPKPLPARPSLEQYKKQAKELLKAYRSADVETIRRVKRNHPRFGKLSEPGFDISKFALADAQLVIAREHGFESWPKFARRIEVLNSEAAALKNPVAAFIEAAIWHGTLDAAEAILAAHPEIAQSSIHVAAILGDDEAVRRLLADDPQNATKKEEPYGGDALVYLCLSKYLRLDPARSGGFLRAATALLDEGADPNTGFWSKDEHREFETALYGAAGVAHHAELTRLL